MVEEEKLTAGHTRLTPAERSERARLAAQVRWSRCRDRTAATAAARDGLIAKYMLEVDPDSVMPIDERRKLAENAQAAHLARMRFLALKAKRAE